jgi:predicted SnoaL-like aldol condensation-catalyzing enzyme
MSRTKKFAALTAIVASALLVASPASAAPHQTTTNTQLITFITNQLFNDENTAVIDQYFSPSYIQHNPTAPDGTAALKQLVGSLPAGPHYDIQRVIAEGDLVILQADTTRGPGIHSDVTDLYRIENGLIVEHWDVIQSVATTTASGNDMFATLSQPQVSTPLPFPFAFTPNSQHVVESYFTQLYQDHNTAAVDRYLAGNLIQHDPALPNGAAAVKTAFEAQLAANPNMVVSSAKVIAQGDLVAVRYHFQTSPTDLGQAVVDIYRVRGNKIIEHWDLDQAVPATSANSNTMF